MKHFGIIALFGILASAAPLNKRDIVWVTETNIAMVTVPVTKTVWAGHHGSEPTTSTIATIETTTSVYVASSTSSVATSSTPLSTAAATPSTTATAVPTTTSISVAPTTTAAPATTESPTSSTIQAASTVSSAASATYTGDITYYAVGLGSCGITNVDTDSVVALAVGMMTADWSGNPNDNPLCGSSITISTGGVVKTATIVDTCEGCTGASLDLSSSLFEDFDDLSVGRVSGVNWWYN